MVSRSSAEAELEPSATSEDQQLKVGQRSIGLSPLNHGTTCWRRGGKFGIKD